ncbi:protein-disulfide reductase DsbD family protein [Hymenobacter properus]|uniref:Thioredoxin family protein n=1 Tax=Hymenobacter properus TaxID=2791026 RepID=A0A931FLF4_9BACT|nr:thioredoxin family protein [Hymenobacter properus]MBF9141976.1 thioredoxin family protein [Hymenobacter properus]MBR7720783.1 thioredoxin family protein [Microvirga sp. SRT04]
MNTSGILKFFLLWLGLATSAAAQILTPTHLSTALSQPTAKVGDEVELIINARIDDKWHLYASDFSDEVGPVVFTMAFKPSPAYALVGKLQSVKSHHEQDEVFKGEVAFWEKTGQLRQRIKVLQAGPLTITGTADYQSCTTVDGRCVPGNDPLTFGPLTVTGGAAPAKATGAVAPPAATTDPAKGVAAATPAATAAPATAAATHAAIDTPAVAQAPAAEATTGQPLAAAPAETVAPDAAAPAATAAAASPADQAGGAGLGLWQYLLLAFGAGLVAVIMPCVYPMLPMTVSYFTNMGGTRGRSILMACVYGLSIIAIYTSVGVVLSLLFGADAANVISSHWLPNLLSFVIFILFGLSFLGLFEIQAPSSLVNKVDAQADKGGWTGLFFMAATLVLVSFSCTVPIVGAVAIAASKGELLRPTLGMLAFSLAFALPFIVFALFPTWLKSLPRSGGWLNVLKVVLGFVELGMAFKFLSSADLSYHWGLVPRPLFLTIWIVLAAVLGFYLLGKIKLPHDSETVHVSVPRLVLSMIAFMFAVYLVPGLFGAPLPTLSAIVPPPTRHDFNLATAGTAVPATPAVASSNCAPARYDDILELPLGLNGYFTLQEAIKCAKEQGKPIFVDFTGHNCGNCRRMEADVWSHEEVLRQLREKYVVVALYADDKTTLPASEWYTSPRDNRQKTSIGEQNLDFQISKFNANAQPYYVLLNPDDPTNKPLVAPIAYEPDVAKFSAYLEAGVKQYQSQRSPVAAR